MNFNLILILSVFFIAGWMMVSFAFVKIRRQTRNQKPTHGIQPAFRLADQWMMESQRKIEVLIENAEQPLSMAQNELLELRLEAGRLPQGVKNLRLVRTALEGPLRISFLEKDLAQLAALYLRPVDYQEEDSHFLHFKTDLGLVPLLEVPPGETLSDGTMKSWLNRLSPHAHPTMGGLLYFSNEKHFETCQTNGDWSEALRKLHILVLDFKGLTALLMALKLYHDTNRLIETFQNGIQSTASLVGQADKMNLALRTLSASALSIQFVLGGGIPLSPVGKEAEGDRR